MPHDSLGTLFSGDTDIGEIRQSHCQQECQMQVEQTDVCDSCTVALCCHQCSNLFNMAAKNKNSGTDKPMS